MNINKLPPALAAQIEELWSDGGERTGAAPDTFKRGCLAMWVVDSFALGDMARKLAALENNTVKRDDHERRIRQLQQEQLDLERQKSLLIKLEASWRAVLGHVMKELTGEQMGDPDLRMEEIRAFIKKALDNETA